MIKTMFLLGSEAESAIYFTLQYSYGMTKLAKRYFVFICTIFSLNHNHLCGMEILHNITTFCTLMAQ